MGYIDQRGSEVLTRNECLRLLAIRAGGVGRIGLLEAGRIVIEPVNYRMLDHDVLIQVGPGSMLDAGVPPSMVSFEVDSETTTEAWSVLVRGLMRRVDEAIGAQARPVTGRPLVPEPGSYFMTIRADTISGRRFHIIDLRSDSVDTTPSRQLAALTLRPPVSVPRVATIAEAASAMESHQTSSVLIGEHPSWLVSEHDLIGALAAGLSPDELASEVATRTPLWATTTTTVAEAAAMISKHCVQHLLVITADGTPVGVLSRREALRQLLAERAAGIRA
jgi:uncharacterized protein